MAKSKKRDEESPYPKSRTKSGWTRTAAGYGSDNFEVQDRYQEDGCGVQGPIQRVSVDPNRGISLGRRKGLHSGAPGKEPSGSEFKDVGE